MSRSVGCVEDDPHVRALLAGVLRDAGYAVRPFGSARAALADFTRRPIDLLVTGVRLPDGDGIDLAERVRAARPVPFILLSGAPSTQEVARAHERGAAGFLTKPFVLPALLTLCARALGQGPPPG